MNMYDNMIIRSPNLCNYVSFNEISGLQGNIHFAIKLEQAMISLQRMAENGFFKYRFKKTGVFFKVLQHFKILLTL